MNTLWDMMIFVVIFVCEWGGGGITKIGLFLWLF